MYQDLLGLARDISGEAGKILLKGFRSPDTIVSYKSRTNLVTDADTSSEAYLVSKIAAAYPSHSIVAEEGGGRNAHGEYIWYVDPLDGTNNYAHGLPFFCISIGVFSVELKRVVAGVAYNPFLGEMFTATLGGGARLNGSAIAVSAMDDIGTSLIATGFPYDKERTDTNNLREFNRILPRVQGIRRMGSAAIDLSYVACGRLDGYWEGQLQSWDTAAGSLIVAEAGGTVTRYDGGAYHPEYPEIADSNGRIHGQLTGLLKGDGS